MNKCNDCQNRLMTECSRCFKASKFTKKELKEKPIKKLKGQRG